MAVTLPRGRCSHENHPAHHRPELRALGHWHLRPPLAPPMSYEDSNWVEHCLGLCSTLPDPTEPSVAVYLPGTHLVSRRNGSRAVVAFSDQQTTTLVFGETRSVQFPTQHVNKHYL